MSRLTATQVIERGDYLEPDFDPTELTIPHLLSILTFHNIRYPTPHSKARLVQVFTDEIKPRTAQLKRERFKRENSVASSQGITDAVTGRSLSDDEPREELPPPRRSSRRLSRPPSQTPPAKPDPPKRRRSSAGPSLSRAPSKSSIPQEPVVVEESEPDDKPIKKVSRPRKSAAAAGTQARRVSKLEDVEGWSDNNVFQSGAESSSPVRPSPNGRTSTSARRATRRGRTSMSAPPQISSSSPLAVPPSTPIFDPGIPASLSRRKLRFNLDQPSPALTRFRAKKEEGSSSPLLEAETEEKQKAAAISDEDLAEDVGLNVKISKAIADGGSKRTPTWGSAPNSQSVSTWKRVFLGLLLSALLGITYSFKVSSTSIGYCHPGTNTNTILEERQVARLTAQECTEQLARPKNDEEDARNISCRPLHFVPFPEPRSCTPCPAHAYCTPQSITCEQSFVMLQHPLAHIPFLPELLNGLPGLGPVALPPRCVEDEERRRNIGRLGVGLEHYLAVVRGQRLCMGVSGTPGDGGESAQWGVDIDRVHDHLKRVTVVQKKAVKADEFESLFKQAIADLQRYGYVTTSEDSSGAKYVAAVRTHLDFPCRIRVAGRNAWNEWKAHFFGSILLLLSARWMRGKIASSRAESRRISDLVQVALDTLRNQELAHYTDPVTAPQPYLSSLHLRDLILQDEHSIPARRRLWDKVERIVEGNTNVRASMEELAGGDEARVWRWVGSAQRTNIKIP